MIKPSKKFFQITLIVLAGILILSGIFHKSYEKLLPPAVIKNFPDVIMFAAVGILLWNRKQRSDEKKAEAERKRLEEEAAAARSVDSEDTAAEDTVVEERTAEEATTAEGTAAVSDEPRIEKVVEKGVDAAG
jgi:hypothetical protein